MQEFYVVVAKPSFPIIRELITAPGKDILPEEEQFKRKVENSFSTGDCKKLIYLHFETIGSQESSSFTEKIFLLDNMVLDHIQVGFRILKNSN